MLDPHTYGKSPAALYLAAHLDKMNNPKVTRKVTKAITECNTIINELAVAHLQGVLSLRTFASILASLTNKHREVGYNIGDYDPLAGDLVTNILEGAVKQWKRRAQAAKLRQTVLNRSLPQGTTPPKGRAETLTLEKTTEDLLNRSRKNLRRRNKQNTLYPDVI